MLSLSGIQSTVGKISGILLAPARRYILFPEDILRKSIADSSPDAVEDAARLSMQLVTMRFSLPGMRMLPSSTFLNLVGARVGHRIGAVHRLAASSTDNHLSLRVWHDDGLLGPNALTKGLFRGFLEGFSRREVHCTLAKPDDGGSTFLFTFLGPLHPTPGKTREEYIHANRIPAVQGTRLTDAFDQRFFVKDGRSIFFRGRRLNLYENTLFHFLPDPGERLTQHSRTFFSEVIEQAPMDTRLRVLKNFMTSCGFGIPTIVMDGTTISISLSYPPIGIGQTDRWPYIERLVEGYLSSGDRQWYVRSSRTESSVLQIRYATEPPRRESL